MIEIDGTDANALIGALETANAEQKRPTLIIGKTIMGKGCVTADGENFEGKCSKEVRIKIYCYIAACGLLWSNWCEYKRNLGVEFGEYSLRQYRYAKDYYKIVMEELSNESR